MKRRALHPVPSRPRIPEAPEPSPSHPPPAAARRSPAAASKEAPADPLSRAARLGHHIRNVPLGEAPVQRVFTYMSSPLPDPAAVLRYLLDTGRIATDDVETIHDFQEKAGEEEFARKSNSAKRKRTTRQHSLNDWLLGHGLGKAADVLRAAYEHAGRRTEPAEPEIDPKKKTILNTPYGDGRGDRNWTPKKRRLLGEERSTDHPIVVITWNLEKYGRTSDKEKKRLKREAILKIVDLYHPSVFVMQEVTDAGLLFEGRSVGRGEGVPLGGGLGFANLHRLINPSRGETARPRVERFGENPLDPEETGLISHYPLQEEYGLLQGPLYSAHPYQEYYPLLYEKARVRGNPEPLFIRGGKKGYRLEDVPEGHEEPFSSKGAITRELLVWKVPLQTGGYTFRPSTLEETGREVPTRNVYVCVVHTSPSNQLGIREETEEILRKAEWLRRKTKSPVILAGDWYMEKKNPELFRDLQEGEREGWSLAASELGLEDVPLPERLSAPAKGRKKGARRSKARRPRPRFHQTNFPHKGQGQVADHFVISEDLRVPLTSVIPATGKQEDWLEGGGKPQIDEERDLHSWTDSGADHVPVLTVVYATVTNAPRPSESRRAQPLTVYRGGNRRRTAPPPAPQGGTGEKQKGEGGSLRWMRERGPISEGGVSKGKETLTGKGGLSSSSRGGQRGGGGISATDYVSAVTGQPAQFVPIDGGGLNCYIRSIVTGLVRQGLAPRGGRSIESIVTSIRNNLHLPEGPINAGGREAVRIRAYVAKRSLTWFGVANVQVRANIVQIQQGDWQAQHWESTGPGTHEVWLRYTSGGIGHFDLEHV